MKIFRFDSEVGCEIKNFGSINFILSGIANLKTETHVSCAYLGANGVIGYHQAATPQMFLVVQGQGWVRDEVSSHIPTTTGQVAFWEKGEWHESGTDTGLMTIILEGDLLNPADYMPIKQ